ncbi:cytidyltransferase [Candidatus Formimonas warabiya]|nr:cytidyltransferase [Candidatus Formimonas warabiya]
MDRSLSMQLYQNMVHRLLDPKWLGQFTVLAPAVKRWVKTPDFLSQIERMVDKKDYTCQNVFSLCGPVLSEIAGEDEPQDWLSFIYRYAVGKSFPHTVDFYASQGLSEACMLFLESLRVVSEFQKSFGEDDTWQSKYPMNFLTRKEENNLENPEEYKQFLHAFQKDYVYEMMKINQEVIGFNSLDHILGVHFLSLYIGRQLAEAGLPIDLGRVSGAAAGHDIGKFGCRDNEMSRVPYVHYYYSGEWFKRHQIVYIRHVAIHHSTWDLELENLSLESLILIYADFRVKNLGRKMHIYALADSFDVILQKLDNVDQAKERRYRRVYAKLKDFEDYLVSLGIGIDPHQGQRPVPKDGLVNCALLQGKEVIESIKYLAINHNINLMYQLRNEVSLNTVLEMARSENDWHNLRTYLRIFEEYSTYLTQKQKLNTIKFLYEQMIHPEDDIRRQCAELIGTLIAIFDEELKKEVPEGVSVPKPELTSMELFDQYLQLFFLPDHKIIPLHRTWIWYSVSAMIASLFRTCRPAKKRDYRQVLLKYYQKDGKNTRDFELYLIDAAKYLPVDDPDDSLGDLYRYLGEMIESPENTLRICAWDTTLFLVPLLPKEDVFCQDLKRKLTQKPVYSRLAPENFIKGKIVQLLDADGLTKEKYHNFCVMDYAQIPDIFLSNLKTAVDWVSKKIQVEILVEYALENPHMEALHTAMHFCNLLKSSGVESIRNQAGEALVRIVPVLSLEQRNDVVVELLRALEIRGYQFSEIPYFLGRLLISLQPVELDEMIEGFIQHIKQPNPKLIYLLLRTIGVAIENYPQYHEAFREEEPSFQARLEKMLGILLNGLGNYNSQIKQMAFSVIGKEIFGSQHLSLKEKNHIFRLFAKKVLTLLSDDKKHTLVFLTNAAGLNHIYRFISDYVFFLGEIELKVPEKVAFFPGAFDPYSLSHKEITRTIRNMGFEVYLQTDEFSWSKLTLPNKLRRNIIQMSIAEELNIYLYPDDSPTNLVNGADLKLLRTNFPHSEVYMVVGSDVILNASAYQSPGGEDSIYTFSHIIFERKNGPDEVDQGLDEAIKTIKGKIIKLALPLQYEDISSTQIRNYIDENRDISSLVDPLAQQYIYENGFYRREPQYKTLIGTISIKVDLIKKMTVRIEQELSMLFPGDDNSAVLKKLSDLTQKFSAKMMAIRDVNQGGKILGFSVFHNVRAHDFYLEFKNSMISEYIRENAVGRIVIIDGIFVDRAAAWENLEQTILSETLAFCLGDEYHYAVYKNEIEDDRYLNEILQLHGFQRLPYDNETHPVFLVNMNTPCTLMLNVEAGIKEPLRSNSHVKAAIARSRQRLQKALTTLYPGNLVLTFDMKMIHEVLIQKICDENGVPTVPALPRRLGRAMCVPFGNILNRYIVPNTVTKALHTEKYYAPDIKSFTIRSFPHYLNLENQMKMLKSFNRPVILVDDLLHKGYRVKAIDPLLKDAKVEVEKIMVGLLSGRGKELMDIQNRKVDGAYFIPRLKAWFNEDILYPFIGGDTLWRGVYPERNLLPSVNLILPYAAPHFLNDAPNSALYNMSEVCIENAVDILTTLEQEYLAAHGRTLTLALLGEVFIAPRCPDQGQDMNYDLKYSPSYYLQNDLEMLRRIEQFVDQTKNTTYPSQYYY